MLALHESMENILSFNQDAYPKSIEEELEQQYSEGLCESKWTDALRSHRHLTRQALRTSIERRKCLALGGGGNLGFVHLGVLDILDKVNGPNWCIEHFSTFVGASIGALLAFYFYARCPPRLVVHRLLPMFLKKELGKQFSAWRALATGGLLDIDQFEGVVREFLLQLDIDPMLSLAQAHDLYGADGKRHFACAVANLSRNCTQYICHQTFPDLPVARALAISMAYPLLVGLCPLRGEEFSDGGMFGMVPLEYTPAKDTLALHASSCRVAEISSNRVAGYSVFQMLGVIIYSMNSKLTKGLLREASTQGLCLLHVPAESDEGMFEITMNERRRLVHIGRSYMCLVLWMAFAMHVCVAYMQRLAFG